MLLVDAMFTKRPLPKTEELIAAKRLRENLVDLYASNIVSADRAGNLFSDAELAGAAHVKDLAMKSCPKNCSRGLMSKLLKRSSWPSLYYAKIRLYCLKKQQIVLQWVPVLLPHELLAALLQYNDVGTLCRTSSAAECTKTRIESLSNEHNIKQLIGFGLWGDGVPANWDRSESYEILSLNLPGVAKLRLPITCVSKKFWTKESQDDLMAIITWSCDAAFRGVHPTARHDGAAFIHPRGDGKRKKTAGKSLGYQAALVEIRADWSWYQSALRFPAHNTKLGCCWKCSATPQTMRRNDLHAEWRQHPLTHWDNLRRWLEQGRGVSPIFSAPTVTIDICQIDWLHAMDKGVAASFLGSLLWMLLPLLRGDNLSARCSSLFKLIQQWYQDHGTTDRFQNLVPTMIKQPKKTPELRGNASQIRALVPCCADLATNYLCDEEPQITAKQAAQLLAEVYDNLAHGRYHSADIAVKYRQFVTLVAALEASSNKQWRLKPKFHLACHLAESRSNPADTWTYRDEDFGGAVAALTRRRGGTSSPLATARRMLRFFCIKHKVPYL